jgi:hypothetical protein
MQPPQRFLGPTTGELLNCTSAGTDEQFHMVLLLLLRLQIEQSLQSSLDLCTPRVHPDPVGRYEAHVAVEHSIAALGLSVHAAVGLAVRECIFVVARGWIVGS